MGCLTSILENFFALILFFVGLGLVICGAFVWVVGGDTGWGIGVIIGGVFCWAISKTLSGLAGKKK
jgi:hypothetical protein